MKKSILCVAALIVAAIVSVTVVSCKKDKDEVVKATNSEAQALLNRIEAFQTRVMPSIPERKQTEA